MKKAIDHMISFEPNLHFVFRIMIVKMCNQTFIQGEAKHDYFHWKEENFNNFKAYITHAIEFRNVVTDECIMLIHLGSSSIPYILF